MAYTPDPTRYEKMEYRKCGNSGLKLPAVSLGIWHNFGTLDDYQNMKEMLFTAFDLGITHFDAANNYGPEPGSAEENLGRILREEFEGHRDELLISTKAGYTMWPGPYGDWGSRKYILASLDQSLSRLGLDYVDIFYHHRPDPETPLEETLGALATAVHSGKALYAGLSRYDGPHLKEAVRILNELQCPFVLNQVRYHIFDRNIEQDGLLDTARELNKGIIVFSPLAQGLLTGRYLNGIPADSRVKTSGVFLKESQITEDYLAKARALNAIAAERGQSLTQMALSWVLKTEGITSVLIGASNPRQIEENVAAVAKTAFSDYELAAIDSIAGY
ncbi:MAG: aldo/keto reductase [Clostridia bacterium]|nr:aldo/keto reductase [Clostridia bacterium]